MAQNDILKRITAWIVLATVVFVMSFSVLFISHHADHECTGEDCSVCAVMVMCSNNIKNIGTIVVALATAFFVYISVQKSVRHVNTACSFYSLISQKVRMNN